MKRPTPMPEEPLFLIFMERNYTLHFEKVKRKIRKKEGKILGPPRQRGERPHQNALQGVNLRRRIP